MVHTGNVEADILLNLERHGSCSIEDMLSHLPGYTWNQVFGAVDRLTRCARVSLRRPSRFGYELSLVRAPETHRSH